MGMYVILQRKINMFYNHKYFHTCKCGNFGHIDREPCECNDINWDHIDLIKDHLIEKIKKYIEEETWEN